MKKTCNKQILLCHCAAAAGLSNMSNIGNSNNKKNSNNDGGGGGGGGGATAGGGGGAGPSPTTPTAVGVGGVSGSSRRLVHLTGGNNSGNRGAAMGNVVGWLKQVSVYHTLLYMWCVYLSLCVCVC